MSLLRRWIVLCVIIAMSGAAAAHSRAPHTRPVYAALTVHEWGTFTSIAGNDGEAMQWWPLTGPADLPSFVEHYRDAQFKFSLEGTVRMETPVLYFYAPRDQTVSVNVRFSKGVITDWYPHASRIEPHEALYDASLAQPRSDGSIAWDAVRLVPASELDLPAEGGSSHYYTARQTTSTPLVVRTPGGEQREKFLFYRGVSVFSVPVSATIPDERPSQHSNQSKVRIENHGQEEIPNTILFERRGDQVGYRIGGPLRDMATLNSPGLTGRVDELCRELEGILVDQGLFQNEAQAMVETWRDSWFEEGSRLLYIVPEKFVNSVLPLTITPAPAQITRVFVGRLELVTFATQKAVQQAATAHDEATLAKYGRFLQPILQIMLKTKPGAATRDQLQAELEKVLTSQFYLNRPKGQ
jgi:hypothetical protein